MKELSLHLLDIIQNSISAGATLITVEIKENTADDLLEIDILDNGRGMNGEQVEKLSDPFFTTRTTRRVGMGIPLFRQNAEQSGGGLKVQSSPGNGTSVSATFGLSNIDRPPMGSLANSFILTVGSNPDIDFVLDYTKDGEKYVFDTREVKEALDGVSISEPSLVGLLTEMIEENLKELAVGA